MTMLTNPSTTTARNLCPDDHKHDAAATCYVLHRCRCAKCRMANSQRERTRTRLKAYGRWENPYVDAAPVRAHVESLRARGFGYKTIAQLAGVSTTGVRALLYGREDYQNGSTGPRHGEQLQRIGRDKAEKILALEPTLEQHPRSAHVPALGTVRRIQALIAHGWSQSQIARQTGVDIQVSSRLLKAARDSRTLARHLIRASTALAIANHYDRLSITPPPTDTHQQRISVARSRNRAAAAGWPMPMDWEAVENDFDRQYPVRRSAS